MGELTVPEDTSSQISAAVTFTDAHGHPTTPDDVPQWASNDENVATAAASEDGLTCQISVVGPGSTVISVSSTNDDGTTVQASGLLNVTAGDAVMGSVEFVEKAPTTPQAAPPPPAEAPPLTEEPPEAEEAPA